MKGKIATDIVVRRLKDMADADTCARMMAESEPWITLGRGYDEGLAILTDASRDVYLAQLDSSILGFVVVEMDGAFTGYIKSICVAPEHRGRGVGVLLMSYVENKIFEEKPNVFICVSSFNEGAKRFYIKLGYEIIGELKDFLVAGHSEILMRKTIAPLTEFMEK
ncbi:MAG: GNAT family N-acetyltransferase [Candidatus Bathyarchaeota archaeon]|nr:GNAT family N-acetyltransferase [Candidatus Bathyarchaeota archaeon]